MISNDLISRKALQNSIRREDGIAVDGMQYIRVDAVLEKIRLARPEEAEVQHARWIHRMDGWYCSGCKKRAMVDAVGFAKYCCRCGAKMDGGPDE